MYVERARLFLGIGVLLIPLGFVISLAPGARPRRLRAVGVDTTGEGAGALVLLVVAIGTTLTLLGLGARPGGDGVRARRDRRRRRVGPLRAYRHAFARVRPLLGAIGLAVVVWVVLTATAS